MTAHFGDTVTADEIIEAWNHYGLPGAFIRLSDGDVLAHNCWMFLEFRKRNPKLTIDDFIGDNIGPAVDEFREVLKEVLNKLDNEKDKPK